MAGAWHRESGFIAALAGRIRETLARVPEEERDAVPGLLTAHSLPRRVADQEPDYLAQLEETASAVAADAGLGRERWTFCWQSAGHEPGERMKPDFADLMPSLAAQGHRRVLVAPVQFLADHLEILYDIDIGALEQAEAAGLTFARIDSLNTDVRFIAAPGRRRTARPRRSTFRRGTGRGARQSGCRHGRRRGQCRVRVGRSPPLPGPRRRTSPDRSTGCSAQRAAMP